MKFTVNVLQICTSTGFSTSHLHMHQERACSLAGARAHFSFCRTKPPDFLCHCNGVHLKFNEALIWMRAIQTVRWLDALAGWLVGKCSMRSWAHRNFSSQMYLLVVLFPLFVRIDLFVFASFAVGIGSCCRDKFLFNAFVLPYILLFALCSHLILPIRNGFTKNFRFYNFLCTYQSLAHSLTLSLSR